MRNWTEKVYSKVKYVPSLGLMLLMVPEEDVICAEGPLLPSPRVSSSVIWDLEIFQSTRPVLDVISF